MDISFICCVWNEYTRAPVELKKVLEFMRNSSLSYEILLIDNFSTDGTRAWAEQRTEKNVTAILNDKNIGKGGSIRKGIEHAKGEIAIIFDLDGEYLIEDAIKGYEFIKNTNSTVALASRTIDGTADYIYLQNYLGVKLITWLINILFSVRLTDTATGLKILKCDFFKTHKLRFSGFNVDFEIVCLALKEKMKVSEYKGAYFPRSKAEGKKIKAIQDGLQSFFAILATYGR